MYTTSNYFTHKSKYISYAAFKVIRVLFEGLGATMLQFLRAVSHAVGAHTDALQPSQHADCSDDDDDDEQLTPTVASASV